eukprot:TRINITY_DN3193_c0_g1_i3.p1 TRINITY_DN3193_c0_g1~~TRINITY_DN3193_c0_g1_i3.p1  ORF type:complete len:469 (+),score=111.39 TRINITY_DN3193_c0_g1_i3:1515-2921(+)
MWYRGRFGSEKRYYVWNVETCILHAFKKEEDADPFRTYDLSGMESITISELGDKENFFPFEIKLTKKVLKLAATADFERKEWVRILSRRQCTCRSFNVHRIFSNVEKPSPSPRDSLSRDQSVHVGFSNSLDERTSFIARNRLKIAKRFQMVRSQTEESPVLLAVNEYMSLENGRLDADVLEHLMRDIFQESENPFKTLLDFFHNMFKVSYFSISVDSKESWEQDKFAASFLRQNAVDDVLSLTLHLREMFCSNYTNYAEKKNSEYPVDASSKRIIPTELSNDKLKQLYLAILKAVLKSVYSTVFALFRNEYFDEDSSLELKYRQLELITTEDLGISPEFCLDSKISEDGKNPFQRAIDGLLCIKTTFEPNEKLKMIANVSQLICECIDVFASGKMIDANDLLLFYAYIVIKSCIPDIHAEIAFINCFLPERKSLLMEDYYYTTLCAGLRWVMDMPTFGPAPAANDEAS